MDENKKYYLTLPKLLKAYQVINEKYPHHLGDALTGEGDATTGDVLIQCALFNDIVYA